MVEKGFSLSLHVLFSFTTLLLIYSRSACKCLWSFKSYLDQKFLCLPKVTLGKVSFFNPGGNADIYLQYGQTCVSTVPTYRPINLCNGILT